MAKMYTLDDKLLASSPEIRIGDKVYSVDNRVKTVKKVMKMYEKGGSMGVDDVDKMLALAYGENVSKINSLDLSWEAYQELVKLTIAAMTGEETGEAEERFQKSAK